MKWKPEYIEKLPSMFANGESVFEVCKELGIHRDTFNDWCHNHPDFNKAYHKGLELSRAWWEKLGRDGASGKKVINSTAYIFNMKVRFRAIDRPEYFYLNEQAEKRAEKKETLSKIEKLKNTIMEFWSRANKPCPLFTNKRFVLAYGGRSGGKSFAFADIVLYKILTREKKGTVICGREIMNSIKDSVKALLEKRIIDNGLEEYFLVTNNEIKCTLNQCNIIFQGSKTATETDSIKGVVEAFLYWGDEAQAFSQKTLDKLIPTLVRVENFQLLFSMNRQFDEDPTFVELTTLRKDESLIININYWDNPYCPKELYDEAEKMKIANFPKWTHIYGGEPQIIFDNSLFTDDMLKDAKINITFERNNYQDLIIAIDPATTNKDFSNEYGIQVLGKRNEEVHEIEDLSGNYSPNDFAKKVVETYKVYNADRVVIETNQGGDFIKSAILSVDPTLNTLEVRARGGQDKITRAKPVANLLQMGKVKFIKSFARLENQLQRMTENGFVGKNGESPDRVDAFVWGVLHLFNIIDMDTEELIIKRDMFLKPIGKPKFEKNIIVTDDGQVASLINYNINYDENQMATIEVKDFDKISFSNLIKNVENYGKMNYNIIVCNNEEVFRKLSNVFAKVRFEEIKREDKVMICLDSIVNGFIRIGETENKQYMNEYGNLLLNDCCKYKGKEVGIMLENLCNLIIVEKGL